KESSYAAEQPTLLAGAGTAGGGRGGGPHPDAQRPGETATGQPADRAAKSGHRSGRPGAAGSPGKTEPGADAATPAAASDAHLSGWFQFDSVWWSQSRNTTKQLGDFEDGEFFRRVRLQADGGFWEVYEYNLILGFENTQKSIVSLFELWAGIKDVPWLGMVRV